MIDNEKIYDELLNLLEKLDVKVKYDRGNFRGGLVKYHDEDIFYINRKADLEVKINTILNELKDIEIPDQLLTEDLKSLLESAFDQDITPSEE